MADQEPGPPPADALRDVLIVRFGKEKGEKVFDAIRDHSGKQPNKDSTILIIDPKNVNDAIVQSGIFGLGRTDLLKTDSFITSQRNKRAFMLRFMEYYLQPEEFRALSPAFMKATILSDQSLQEDEDAQRLLRSCHEHLSHLRNGNHIYNIVSSGRLTGLIFPEMRRIENSASPAGRVTRGSGDAERIRQVFYNALKFDPATLWVSSQMDFQETFDRIAARVAEHAINQLDVHGAGQAWATVQRATATYARTTGYAIDIYQQADNPNAGYVRIRLQ